MMRAGAYVMRLGRIGYVLGAYDAPRGVFVASELLMLGGGSVFSRATNARPTSAAHLDVREVRPRVGLEADVAEAALAVRVVVPPVDARRVGVAAARGLARGRVEARLDDGPAGEGGGGTPFCFTGCPL